ncbi:MAG: hypothetical protein PHS14_00155 [Elusimicrobia bacterium]|nr:hypothetical protein [Elusimicrobiota bacterium]
MLGLPPEAAVGLVGAVTGSVSIIASGVLTWATNNSRREHDLEMKQKQDDLDRLEASQRKAWEYLDDLRINAVRRVDQDRLREEFRADIKVLGDRLEAAIGALRADLHKGGS